MEVEVQIQPRAIGCGPDEAAGEVMNLVLVVDRVAEPLCEMARVGQAGISDETEGALDRPCIPQVAGLVDGDVEYAIVDRDGEQTGRDGRAIGTSDGRNRHRLRAARHVYRARIGVARHRFRAAWWGLGTGRHDGKASEHCQREGEAK